MGARGRSRFGAALERFWQRDESLTLLLALLVLFSFVLPLIAVREGPRGPVTLALFACVLGAGMTTVLGRNPWAVRAVGLLFAVTLAVRVAAWLDPGVAIAIWSSASATFALALLALVVISMVVRPGTVTRRRIEGAIAAYLLLGLTWAAAYDWVAQLDPAAFAGAIEPRGMRWIYYSLVTLSTMGYGDITPVSPVARSLAVSEAIAGQLYLAIMISRLVALELQARQERSGR